MAIAKLAYLKIFLDTLDAIEPLGDAERGRLFTALMQYAKTGEAPQLYGNERFIFPMMRAQVDRDKEEYQAFCEKQAKNGAQGGRPKNPKKPSLSQKAKKAMGFLETQKSQDKDKDKDKEINKDICAELSQAPAPEDATEILLPLNDGSQYPITKEQCHEWAGLYPAVDVIQQLRNMKGWLDGNPRKRKTRAGIARFINAWLAKEQDRGGTPGYSPPSAAPPPIEYGPREILPDTHVRLVPEDASDSDIWALF